MNLPEVGDFSPVDRHYTPAELMNLYSYVANEPMNSMDVFGLVKWKSPEVEKCFKDCVKKEAPWLAAGGIVGIGGGYVGWKAFAGIAYWPAFGAGIAVCVGMAVIADKLLECAKKCKDAK
jgi:hypothetical protein